MSDCYIGEIRMFAGDFAPAGWAFCDGSVLSVSEQPALFAAIGNSYGGKGLNFKLPDLRGRLPIHYGAPAGPPRGGVMGVGESLGVEAVTLREEEIKAHTHAVAAAGAASAAMPGPDMYPADSTSGATIQSWAQYRPAGHTTVLSMEAVGVWPSAPAAPHPNLMPTTCINFIIALEGLYPVHP